LATSNAALKPPRNEVNERILRPAFCENQELFAVGFTFFLLRYFSNNREGEMAVNSF
jgi:hypothetical protein